MIRMSEPGHQLPYAGQKSLPCVAIKWRRPVYLNKVERNQEQGSKASMTAVSFDFTPLLPAGLHAAAARWTGLAKYSFVGGNNDPDQVPVEGLIDAVSAVLKREGRTLATYGLASGPQGYRPLRQFLTAKL